MTSTGSVRMFDPDLGWGVIDGPDVPGGCWVHFSALVMEGYRMLVAGQQVSFRAEAADQDGFAWRAVKVWTDGGEPSGRGRAESGSGERDAGHRIVRPPSTGKVAPVA